MSLPDESFPPPPEARLFDPEALSPSQLRLFELVGEGKTNAELAESFGIAVSTVHTNKRQIRNMFNFASPLDMREAGQRFTAKVTTGSIAVQSKVVESIDLVKTTQQKTDPRAVVSNRPFSVIRNQSILRFLYENDYITERMLNLQKVGLRGLVAALLLKDVSTRPYVTDRHMRSYTREIIDREVELALQ